MSYSCIFIESLSALRITIPRFESGICLKMDSCPVPLFDLRMFISISGGVGGVKREGRP